MAINAFQSIFERIDNTMLSSLAGGAANLISIFSPLFQSVFAVYVMFVVWSYWQNAASFESGFVDMAKRLLAWGLILGFSVNISGYNSAVMPLVLGLGDGLSQSFNGNFTSNSSALDSLVGQLIDVMNQNMDGARQASGLDAIGAIIDAISQNFILLIFGGLFCVVAAAYILLAKVFLAILAVLGPVFLALLLFPSSRQYGVSWINQVLNYSLLLLLLNIVGGFFVNYVDGVLDDAIAGSGIGGATGVAVDAVISQTVGIHIFLVCVLFIIILWKLPELASGLAGGVAANGFSGLASAAVSAGRLAKFAGAKSAKSGGGISKGAKTPESKGTSKK